MNAPAEAALAIWLALVLAFAVVAGLLYVVERWSVTAARYVDMRAAYWSRQYRRAGKGR